MAIHRLTLDEFDEVNYELIAIHTSLEDYHLAYFVNQKLPILLGKNKSEIQVRTKDGEAFFSRYTYTAEESDHSWELIQNKNEVVSDRAALRGNLFSGSTSGIEVTAYFLPEFKKVDYFLRMQNTEESAADVAARLQQIPRITTVYPVDAEKIKSKNNLIF